MKIHKKNFRKIAFILICAIILSLLASCKKEVEQHGNMKAIGDLQPGDTYAVMKFKDFDGELTFILFDEIAPIGVKEFTQAANNRYYDGKTFHRVLQDMLVQGGALNMDGSDATIPPEEMFEVETHTNARNFYGALCFALDPESGMNYRQFYIVTANGSVDIDKEAHNLKEILDKAGEDTFSAAERKAYENLQKEMLKLPDTVKERYLKQGGLHLLDDTVTVFGQLITGWDLLEEISKVDVVAGNKIDDNNTQLNDGKGQNSRPANNIFIESIRIIHIPEEVEDDEDQGGKSKKGKKSK